MDPCLSRWFIMVLQWVHEDSALLAVPLYLEVQGTYGWVGSLLTNSTSGPRGPICGV